MTSSFCSSFFSLNNKRTHSAASLRSLIGCTALIFALGSSAFAVAEESARQEMAVKIMGIENYFAEQCVTFAAGKQVRYHFTSPHPLDFNVHYHSKSETNFEAEEQQVTEYSGAFVADVEREYCFMWTNKKAVGEDWDLTLHYQTSAK